MRTYSEDLACPGASASSWLQRHWGSAVKLKLAWNQSDAVSWVVDYDAPPLCALQHLEFSLDEGDSSPEDSLTHVAKWTVGAVILKMFQCSPGASNSSEENSQASAMFLARLMGQPTGLRLFAATMPVALVVPPLQTLRHLALKADAFEDAAIAAVCHLHGLLTLKLAAKSLSIKCARLALGSMASLRNVAIQDICPAALDLPSCCKLHIAGWPTDLARRWWADAGRAGQVASLELFHKKPDTTSAMPHFLPNIGCTALFWVTRKGESIHRIAPAIFKAPAFTALSALYLDGTNVYIYIHASLRLRTLHITAKFLKEVAVEDPEALAANLEEFSVLYYVLVGCRMVELALALQRVGKAVNRVDATIGGNLEAQPKLLSFALK
ncbi:hypothetical protein COCOBI_15-3220 [Coccomyxa sp. Obi]|nr:hypothetical protein COCOBI_15-3220 [Coccomyxa sp. Obi]